MSLTTIDNYLILHCFCLQYRLFNKPFVTVDKAITKIKKTSQFSLSLNKIADTKITDAQTIEFIIINFFILV